ncbi:hypothetical protein N657DRAFT_367653 [Parathielavia appendiculata]|uniref:Uncharacterized protein n=1 Tax=Parathielavia appendiculata TaxID=2587402 RepID=A0AAN6TQ87_9PEZI|nr:hypothetical protein N657DRAFT_367653 [Parathielavia appendiculata]
MSYGIPDTRYLLRCSVRATRLIEPEAEDECMNDAEHDEVDGEVTNDSEYPGVRPETPETPTPASRPHTNNSSQPAPAATNSNTPPYPFAAPVSPPTPQPANPRRVLFPNAPHTGDRSRPFAPLRRPAPPRLPPLSWSLAAGGNGHDGHVDGDGEGDGEDGLPVDAQEFWDRVGRGHVSIDR